jgi:hypothetical protein
MLLVKARRAAIALDLDDERTPAAWARVGELERFANDLINMPTPSNKRVASVTTYTLSEAMRKYKMLNGGF